MSLNESSILTSNGGSLVSIYQQDKELLHECK